eukprot:COSAG01_NODE_4433_length_5029_cov_21.493103_1_plen_114_part_00
MISCLDKYVRVQDGPSDGSEIDFEKPCRTLAHLLWLPRWEQAPSHLKNVHGILKKGRGVCCELRGCCSPPLTTSHMPRQASHARTLWTGPVVEGCARTPAVGVVLGRGCSPGL